MKYCDIWPTRAISFPEINVIIKWSGYGCGYDKNDLHKYIDEMTHQTLKVYFHLKWENYEKLWLKFYGDIIEQHE